MSDGDSAEPRVLGRPVARREFLRGATLFGAFALASAFLPGCLTGAGTSVSKEGPVSKVSVVRTSDRAEGVRRAIALLALTAIRGKAVILKPNFNSADETPGSTHIDTLRSLVGNIKELGATSITLAERSGPGDPTSTVMEKKGVPRLAGEMGFDIVNLQGMDEAGWALVRPEGAHWQDGFLFPRIYQDAECIVQTCCLKTHAYGGHFTMSLKNSVGMVPGGSPYMRQLHNSAYQRQMIAEINAAYETDLVVLDGVEAFVDGGPARGTRADANVVLASSDRVAIDAVGVAMLRSLGTTPDVSRGRVFEQDQIARAAEIGVGAGSPEEIELVTEDAESRALADELKEILLA